MVEIAGRPGNLDRKLDRKLDKEAVDAKAERN